VIAAPTPQQIVNECAAGLQTYCSYVTRSQPGNVLLSVLSANLNLGSLKTNGFDANLSYTTQLSRFGMKGDLTLRAMGNYILKNTESLGPGTQEQEYAGDVAYGYGFGVPHFNMLMNAAYDYDHLGVQIVEHYVGGGLDAPPGVSTYAIESSIGPAATISGQWWTDLTLTYRFDKISVYGTITNLFNSDPPIIPASGYAQGVTNYTLYETLGRAFVVGVHGRW